MAKEVIEAEVKSNIGEVAKDAEKLGEATKKAQSGVKKLSVTFSSLAKASGIVFLLNKAFEVFQEVFRQNQKVVDVFNVAFEVLSIAFNDFFKFLESNINTATGFMDKIFGNEVVQNVIDFGRTLVASF